MRKLTLVNIDKIQNTSLKEKSIWDYREINSLNKLLKRIEKKLNSEATKEVKNGKHLEELTTITAKNIKYYPFKIRNMELEKQLYKSLKSANIQIIKKYSNDMTLSSQVANFFSINGQFSESMCDVKLVLKK